MYFPVSAEGFKWRREAEEERKEGEKSKQARRQRGKKGETQTRKYAIALFVSIPPSLPHSPTHSSKYNDHRKVISKLSQSEDSEPTESHKKRGNGETEETVGYHSPVVYAYRKEQLVMRERG